MPRVEWQCPPPPRPLCLFGGTARPVDEGRHLPGLSTPVGEAAGKSCAAGTLAAGVCSVFWAAFEQHLPSISNC